MGLIRGIVASLTLAERKLAAIEDVERKRRWARRWLQLSNLWDVAKRTGYRYRDQWWPIIIGLGLLTGRVGADGTQPAAVAVGSLLGAAVVVFRVRRALTRRAEWVYTGTCLGAVTFGLTLTSVVGMGERWLNVGGLLTWGGLSLLWWGHHEVRGWPGQAKAKLVNLWNVHVRDSKGAMAGAELVGPVPFEHGDTYTVMLVPYKQTLAKATADLPNWTTALDTPFENLVLEQHPDHPKRPTMLRLQHVTRSPIENTVHFDRPRHNNGRIMLGPHADGIGEASLRLYTRNRMHSTFLIGDTGSGKTRLTETVALSALDLRNVGMPTVIFYMDGQDGASSPTLFQHATWAVGSRGVPRMLSALERVAAYRNAQNRAKQWAGFTPTADRPGIFVIMDEVNQIIQQAPERFARAAASWAKLGICFLASDQDSSLKVWLEDKLRTALLAGNGIVMKVTSRIAGNLVPGLDINPADLPVMPGYGVFLAARNSGQRTAGFRGRYSPDETDAADAAACGETLPVPTIEAWFGRYPPLELDKGAARAAGDDYQRRHEIAQQEQDALVRYVEGEETDAGAERALFGVAPEPGEDGGVGRSMRERILALDWERYGEMERAQIITELQADGGELNVSTFTKALSKLVKPDGELVRAEHGRYRRTNHQPAN